MKDEDLKITVPRGEYHGGQSAGLPNLGVEVTHIPTGLRAFSDYHRSQLKNRDLAKSMIEWGLLQLQ